MELNRMADEFDPIYSMFPPFPYDTCPINGLQVTRMWDRAEITTMHSSPRAETKPYIGIFAKALFSGVPQSLPGNLEFDQGAAILRENHGEHLSLR